MDEATVRRVISEMTSHAEYEKRIGLCEIALRKQGMDAETRGVVLGRLTELEWVRDILPDLLFRPSSASTRPDDTHQRSSPERVAPLRSSRRW